MLLFRFAIVALLLAAGVSFAFYIGTGQERFKTLGIKLVKWAIMAGLGFFGIMVLERAL
jgi:hypothetical protein